MDIGPLRRHSIITFTSVIGLTIIGFVSTMYFAHVVGPAVLGAYFLFLAYLGIFNLIGEGGFGDAVVKRISEGIEKNEYFSAFFVLRILLIIFSVAAVYIYQGSLKDLASSDLVEWLILALVVSGLEQIARYGVYGIDKVGVNQAGNLISTIVRVGIQVAAVAIGYGAAGLVGGVIAGFVVSGAINFHFLKLSITRFTLRHVQNLLFFSFWICITAGGVLVYTYADTVIIGYYLSNTEVGIYRAVFQFTTAAIFVALTMRTVLYPKISYMGTRGEYTKIESHISRAITFSLLLAVPICIGGWVLGDSMLFYFYGAAFTEGTTTLFILLAMQVINIFMYLEIMCLNAVDMPKEAFIATFIGLFANVVLDIVLIPYWGITGAAFATLISLAMNVILAYCALKGKMSVKFEKSPIFHILAAGFLMGIFLVVYRVLVSFTSFWHLAVALVVGLVLYLFLILRFDAGIRDDIKHIATDIGIKWPVWL
ncbi:MAG: flippase [bacterium]